MDELFDSNDPLLFGTRKSNVNLFTLHPEQAQILKLWQVYLENVHPLLEVTHMPTLQARIIDSISDLKNITPTLEALMFSIYCVAVMSLTEEECQSLGSKQDLMRNYQFACQQALLNCGVLRSSDRDCLTALHLYLVSQSTRDVPSNPLRSPSDRMPTPDLCIPPQPSLSALRNEWESTMKRDTPNAQC